jgi:hypothetical protein
MATAIAASQSSLRRDMNSDAIGSLMVIPDLLHPTYESYNRYINIFFVVGECSLRHW